jgi:hypothetical protein
VFFSRVVARILDHLTAPMRRLHLEDREFVALKAVAFFDPSKFLNKCYFSIKISYFSGQRH